MIWLEVRILAIREGVGCCRSGGDAYIELTAGRTQVKNHVLIIDSGNYHAEDTNGNADTLRMDGVAQVAGGVGCVVVYLQCVVAIEVLQRFRVGQRGVCLGERTCHVGKKLVELVVLRAVILLQALMDIVQRLHLQLFIGRYGYNGNDKQDEGHGGQNDNLSQTAVIELLEKCFALVSISVKLVHNN